MKVKLNEIEQRAVYLLAQKRKFHNIPSDYTFDDMALGEQGPEAMLLAALGAEVAFCKLKNLYPDWNWTERRRSDIKLANGAGVDIKHTFNENGNLLVPHWKQFKRVMYYVLAIGPFADYEFVGYTTDEVVFLKKNLIEIGDYKRPCFKVDREVLVDVCLLK